VVAGCGRVRVNIHSVQVSVPAIGRIDHDAVIAGCRYLTEFLLMKGKIRLLPLAGLEPLVAAATMDFVVCRFHR